MKRYFTALLFFVCLAAHAPAAEASLRPGLFRFGLDSTLFRFGFVHYEYEEMNRETEFKTTSFGLGVPNAGLNLGGVIVNGLVLGGKIHVGQNNQEEFFGEEEFFMWSVMPYLEYVFLRGVIRPYITLSLGAEGVEGYGNDDTGWWGFSTEGGGGLHFFGHPNVSLDLGLLVGFVVGGGEVSGVDLRHWRFNTSCLIGVSGWF